MVTVSVRSLVVEYPEESGRVERALDGLDLDVGSGELLVVAGPSGSGKTTLLRAIVGLAPLLDGTVSIDGRIVNALKPGDRDIAMVSQLETVFPHLDVGENLAFALELRKTPEEETRDRVRAEARTLGLWSRLRRRPSQLSTGERQKVALGRATTRRPRLFLFDEPLSNLDPVERDRMRRELRRLQQGLGVTSVYVTHDQHDAMTLADRVAVLDRGRVVQVGEPMELYRRPANLFMAQFFGTPPMGIVQGPLRDDGSTAWIDVAGSPLRLHPVQRERVRGQGVEDGVQLAVGVRTDALDLGGRPRTEWTRTLEVTVGAVEPLGRLTIVSLLPAGTRGRRHGRLYAATPPGTRVRSGDRHTVTIDLSDSFVFDVLTGLPLSSPLTK